MNNCAKSPPFLVIVIPCYNEQDILPSTTVILSELLDKLKNQGIIRQESLICYVDDGSTDKTWDILEKRHEIDPFCRAIKFAGNAGQENAMWAGMMEAYELGCDCAITLDVDLQDDIEVMPAMLADYRNGCEIVYGVRNNRETDTWLKRKTAHIFYSLMSHLNMSIIPDHSQYRLMSKPVLEALQGFEERNLFIRGIMPSLGFKSSRVYYKRLPRLAGETKYTVKKMVSLAWQGITSCSALPLRIAGMLSFICMALSIILAIVFVCKKYIIGSHTPGWTSLFIAILFMGSVQLFCLSVMGEYIAKIFTEVRRRPRYIIEKKL